MIKVIIGIVVGLAALIIGLSIYLQPDDFRNCNATPGITAPCAPADAIVAVSGGDTDARTDQAISLYEHGWSETLVFSGAAQDKSGPSNAAEMRLRAIAKGVPADRIYVDENSETTKENAENTQSIFLQHNIKSIILVTSGYHQRRASLEFKEMSKGIAVYNDPVLTDQDWSFWWWVTPRGWSLALSEVGKIIVFYVSGM
jgi:uncharacterized SAM-binding protein YcdF (DUF218 family)